jgi:hypothetical protein
VGGQTGFEVKQTVYTEYVKGCVHLLTCLHLLVLRGPHQVVLTNIAILLCTLFYIGKDGEDPAGKGEGE